jgi:hypothetical protein
MLGGLIGLADGFRGPWCFVHFPVSIGRCSYSEFRSQWWPLKARELVRNNNFLSHTVPPLGTPIIYRLRVHSFVALEFLMPFQDSYETLICLLIYVPLHYGYVLTMCDVDSVRSSEGSTRVHEDYIRKCTGM